MGKRAKKSAEKFWHHILQWKTLKKKKKSNQFCFAVEIKWFCFLICIIAQACITDHRAVLILFYSNISYESNLLVFPCYEKSPQKV